MPHCSGVHLPSFIQRYSPTDPDFSPAYSARLDTGSYNKVWSAEVSLNTIIGSSRSQCMNFCLPWALSWQSLSALKSCLDGGKPSLRKMRKSYPHPKLMIKARQNPTNLFLVYSLVRRFGGQSRAL